MARKRRRKAALRTYGWVLKLPRGSVELGRLSPRGARGVEYMERLASDGRLRKVWALQSGFAREPLTVDDLAWSEDLTAATIERAIKQARVDLFGADLSDSAVYRRLARMRKVEGQDPGECGIEGCENKLPRRARSTRKHCDFHAAPAERVRRYRAARRERSG